jgi:hypothetical protein
LAGKFITTAVTPNPATATHVHIDLKMAVKTPFETVGLSPAETDSHTPGGGVMPLSFRPLRKISSMGFRSFAML